MPILPDSLITGRSDEEKKTYKNGGKFLSDSDLRKEFTQLKKNTGIFLVKGSFK